MVLGGGELVGVSGQEPDGVGAPDGEAEAEDVRGQGISPALSEIGG
jgi:hypothetical protein